MVALIFGLLHGFGFAGALAEIGLPETDRPLALLTFNLGVEAGQLFVVALVLAISGLLVKLNANLWQTTKLASTYGIGIVSMIWLLERL